MTPILIGPFALTELNVAVMDTSPLGPTVVAPFVILDTLPLLGDIVTELAETVAPG